MCKLILVKTSFICCSSNERHSKQDNIVKTPIYQNENLHSDNEHKSPTCSYNTLGQLEKPQYMKIFIHIECNSENAILMQFYVIIPDIPSFI